MFPYKAETTCHGLYTIKVVCPKCGKTMWVSPDLIKMSAGNYKCPYCGN